MLSFLRCRAVLAGSVMIAGSLAAFPARALVYGLDVYAGNGVMNWPLIAGGGKDFAMVKATEGEYYQDAQLGNNETNGTAAGVLIGCYDFAEPTEYAPASEADYFVNFASSQGAFANGKMVPMLDLETGLGGTIVGASSLSAWAAAWCNEVFAKTGTHAFVYVNQNYAENLTSTISSVAKLDLAAYDQNTQPPPTNNTGPWSSATFIQYTDAGRLAGAQSGAVDLDEYEGTLASLISNMAIGGVAAELEEQVPEPTCLTAILGLGAVGLMRRRRATR